MTPAFPFCAAATDRPLRRIKISAIARNPYQPRKYFDQEAIFQLAESIRTYGVLNPLTVRRTSEGYELIAGERRLRAARAAGLSEVPCIVLSATEEDSSAIALVENLQRRDLDFFEEAQGFRQLIDLYGLTQEEAARRVGKTQSAVANKLRLLKLSDEVVRVVRDGGLTERHARALLRLPDDEQRVEAAKYMITEQLNVSRAEQYIDSLLEAPVEPEPAPLPAPSRPTPIVHRMVRDVRFFLNTLDRAVGVMQDSGVGAKVEREERDDGLLVRILIPNARA